MDTIYSTNDLSLAIEVVALFNAKGVRIYPAEQTGWTNILATPRRASKVLAVLAEA